MDSGRKRIPLGVVSPSAVRNAQRRRPSHDVQTSGNVPSANRENLEPNRASASMPESSFQSPARNDNFVQQPSHSTTGLCTGAKHIGGCSDSGISSGISNSRLNNLGISGRMNKNAQSYLTPSQRRLRNVDFTSPSQCFPSSRLLNRSTGGADQCMPFQMPASTIRKPVTSQPNGNKVKNTMCVNLLDRHTPAKTPSQGNQQSDITVLVPELDSIGVRRPAWYSVEASNRPRNLLHAFNKVGEKSVSENMEHTHLSMIDESKVNWTVKVRVTRMWVSVNVGGLIMRHNMIVLDCENTYACCRHSCSVDSISKSYIRRKFVRNHQSSS